MKPKNNLSSSASSKAQDELLSIDDVPTALLELESMLSRLEGSQDALALLKKIIPSIGVAVDDLMAMEDRKEAA